MDNKTVENTETPVENQEKKEEENYESIEQIVDDALGSDNNENVEDTNAASTSTAPESAVVPIEVKKLARDAKAKRKHEKTVQQLLKSLDNLKSPEEKLSAMCKKYSEVLHENRQLQSTVKQSEKNITMIHREKEQFRHERSKAVLAKTRMEQLCRELQKLNKAQQEETALKLRVEEEKRKEICLTFQGAFTEMNALTNQSNEKSAKMREENLEMREKITSVRERIELTETQLDKVRQQAKLELELAREKLVRVTLELTAEKKALMEDKSQLLMKLAKYHVLVKEHEGTEQFLRKQIKMYEEKFEEFKKDVKKTTESLKNFRPESREMKKRRLKLEKDTALWKQRWENTNAAVVRMTEIKQKRDSEMATLNNKLSTLQELCKVFQRERASLISQLREKNETVGSEGKVLGSNQPLLAISSEENRKSMRQVENISKDCEKLKNNITRLEGSLAKAVRQAFKAADTEGTGNSGIADTKSDGNINNNNKNDETAEDETPQNADDDSIETKDEIDDELSTDNDVACESSREQTIDIEENNKIDSCAAEIAILERHETVLKNIEKVIAEQAELEAKIACVKEIGNPIYPDDAKDITISDAIDNDNGISINEFEMINHDSCIPDSSLTITEITEEPIEDIEKQIIVDRTIQPNEPNEIRQEQGQIICD